jgi:hypothetical protein
MTFVLMPDELPPAFMAPSIRVSLPLGTLSVADISAIDIVGAGRLRKGSGGQRLDNQGAPDRQGVKDGLMLGQQNEIIFD